MVAYPTNFLSVSEGRDLEVGLRGVSRATTILEGELTPRLSKDRQKFQSFDEKVKKLKLVVSCPTKRTSILAYVGIISFSIVTNSLNRLAAL